MTFQYFEKINKAVKAFNIQLGKAIQYNTNLQEYTGKLEHYRNIGKETKIIAFDMVERLKNSCF